MTKFKRPEYAGGHRIRVTPVPIPNTEVKPDTADGTAWATVWESRSLPAVIQTKGPISIGPFVCTAATVVHTVAHAPIGGGAAPASRAARAVREATAWATGVGE